MADYTISKIELPNGDICNIKDTWRGIQDNLTSTSTTDSLSANQGKVLKELVDGKAAASHTHSADAITSGYLNIHPENNPVLIPFMNNDIAYLLKRGGSAVIKYDGTTQSMDLTNIFDASPSYWAINPTGITNITIELTLHKQFTWGNIIYVDFGASDWRSKTVKIEVMNSNYSGDTWSQKYNNTNNSSGHCYVNTGHTPTGASNTGGGFNKIRFTFSGWATPTGFRIAQIGVYNYGSAGLRETFLPKDGGALYGSIYPNSNNGANLGTTSQYFNNAYITNINGVAVGSSPKFTDTTALTSMTGTLAIDHGGTGATTAANARANLGLGSIAVKADMDYVPFKGNITNIGANSPASGVKTYWANTSNIPNLSTALAYNNSGSEYTLLFSKGGNNNYGSILKWGYPDPYIRILRYHYSAGTNSDHWYSEDWEKIFAGYADSAGSVALSGVTGADDLKAIEALSGTSGFLKKTAANTWGLDTNTYLTSSTGVTSIAGKTGAVELSDLGLSNAMHFLGVTTTNISTGTANTTVTITISGSNVTAAAGDVVLYGSQEYVWGNSKWNLLGDESSYKVKQTAKSDPTASTSTSTTFIDTISQDANGAITATKANLPTASTTVAGITTVGASGGAATYGHTHTLSIAADSGTNQLTLAASTKYKLTAGGSTYIFTTPPNNAVTHTVKTTTKYYITGTETSTTSTGGDTFDTGIYATTTAGELSAVRHSYNSNGTEKLYTCYNSTDNSLDFIFV